LAFAVAINVDPDVLIVDEVLSVGDARFQRKSIKKMDEIRNKGTTILFVSHATEQIKRFCTKAIWIDSGIVKMIGDQSIVADKFIDSLYLENNEPKVEDTEQSRSTSGRIAKILDFRLNKNIIKTFDSLELKVEYEVFEENVTGLLIGASIHDNEKNYIFGPNTYLDNFKIKNTNGKYTIIYSIPKMPLLSGTYNMDIGLFTDKGIVNLDFISNAVKFTIENKYFTEGKVYIEHEWH